MDSDKIIDIISGIEFNIKELPLVVGSLSKYDKLNINNQFELEQFVGKTISVNKEQLTIESSQHNYTNNINNIQSKLIISTCPIIYPYDFIINKEEEKNEYNIFSFGKACINGYQIESNKICNLNIKDMKVKKLDIIKESLLKLYPKKIGNPEIEALNKALGELQGILVVADRKKLAEYYTHFYQLDFLSIFNALLDKKISSVTFSILQMINFLSTNIENKELLEYIYKKKFPTGIAGMNFNIIDKLLISYENIGILFLICLVRVIYIS